MTVHPDSLSDQAVTLYKALPQLMLFSFDKIDPACTASAPSKLR